MPDSVWDWCRETPPMTDARPILVVGCRGQVGSELMLRHATAIAPLVGLDHDTVDIGDAIGTRAAVEDIAPVFVINVAAYTAVDKAESEAAVAYAVNRDGAANLAAACAARRIPLLHVSTDYVFDGRKSEAYRETDLAAPLGIYGASKLAGEVAVRNALAQHIILRTAWVFSVHGTNFVKTILRLSAERPELRVVDDQSGCPTPAEAIAEALLAIAARISTGGAAWGTYHFCGSPPTTWCRFAEAIVDAASRHRGKAIPVKPIATADYPTPAKRPANSTLDCAKIVAAYGLSPPDWQRDLSTTVTTLLGRQ
jgi:dTDP-4-dehydrorhamnose reductase